MEKNSRQLIANEWIDLVQVTQTKRRGLSRKLRDELGWTHVDSLVALYGDATIDPRSEGIIGHKPIAFALGRSLRQVERSVYNTPLREELRWADGLPASNVASLAVLRGRLASAARAVHLKALSPTTDISSGSNMHRSSPRTI